MADFFSTKGRILLQGIGYVAISFSARRRHSWSDSFLGKGKRSVSSFPFLDRLGRRRNMPFCTKADAETRNSLGIPLSSDSSSTYTSVFISGFRSRNLLGSLWVSGRSCGSPNTCKLPEVAAVLQLVEWVHLLVAVYATRKCTSARRMRHAAIVCTSRGAIGSLLACRLMSCKSIQPA